MSKIAKKNNDKIKVIVVSVVAIIAIIGIIVWQGKNTVLTPSSDGSTTAGYSAFEPDMVVATVGDKELTWKELDERCVMLMNSYGYTEDMIGDQMGMFRMNTLTTFATEEMAVQLCEKEGITISDEEFAEERKVLMDAFGGEEDFNEYLGTIHATMDFFDETFRNQLLIDKLTVHVAGDIQPTEDQLREYYNKNAGSYNLVDSVTLKQIVCSTKEDAENAKIKYDEGKATFEELLKEYDKSGATTGELGGLAKEDFTDDTIRDTIWETEVGKMTVPLESEAGYHLFVPTGFTKAREVTYEEVKDDVKSDYITVEQNKKFQEYMTTNKDTVKIEYKVDESTLNVENKSQEVKAENDTDK